MKIFPLCFLVGLCLIQLVACAETQASRLRRRLFQQEPCLVLLKSTEYEDHHSHGDEDDKAVYCELFGRDAESSRSSLVQVEGINSEWAASHGVISGETTLIGYGAFIDGDRLGVPQSSTAAAVLGKDPFVLGTLDRSRGSGVGGRRLATTTGSKNVLVVRVIAKDRQTTDSPISLSDSIFGTFGDPVNLKTQFAACSYDQLTFEPAPNQTSPVPIVNGVVDVSIEENVKGASSDTITFAVYRAARSLLGGLSTQFDNVMFCLPPGTSGDWIAYAYINHFLSVYNDRWCKYPSSQMHELAHNLNLGHAGEGGNEYADQSGMMGFSYSRDDTPLMCFNAAKSFQLGWYSDRHTTVNPLSASWVGELVGVADYEADTKRTVVLKINTDSDVDYYVNFNRKTGINAGTIEGGNLVMITKQGGHGRDFATSFLVAKLSGGQMFTIADFNGSGSDVTVTVKGIDKSSPVRYASVAVGIATEAPTTSPTRSKTASPTQIPSFAPTISPTMSPSAAPSFLPSALPSNSPSDVLKSPPTTALPSSVPTLLPSWIPSANPSDEPTQVPTMSTLAPTASSPTLLTTSPTQVPSKQATSKPTYNSGVTNCSLVKWRKKCKLLKGTCRWKRLFGLCVNVNGAVALSTTACPELKNELVCGRQQKERCSWDAKNGLCKWK